MTPLPHGGRLQHAIRRYPGAPQPWIDLSTGINPEAYPFDPPPPEAWRRLPEPEHVAALEAAAARAYGVSDPACVVAAPGTQALIQLLPRLFPQPAIAIPGPTYAEHEAAWRQAGARITPPTPGGALVLCNPNNPDGRRHDPARLAAARHSFLVVDEAFADFEPALSLAPRIPLPGTTVLRSFGKAYGLPGLRLGFALATPAAAAAIRDALGPWPINGPALAIAIHALSDPEWRQRAAATAQRSANRLATLLTASGLHLVGQTTLFATASSEPDAAHRLAHRLSCAGLLVRSFATPPGWLRFGLPPTPAAWDRLERCLNA